MLVLAGGDRPVNVAVTGLLGWHRCVDGLSVLFPLYLVAALLSISPAKSGREKNRACEARDASPVSEELYDPFAAAAEGRAYVAPIARALEQSDSVQ